jgi:hypothetical protein
MFIFNCLLVTLVASYGQIGHSLTGSVAQDLLTPKSVQMLKELIPEFDGMLSPAANWGDTIKSDRSYDWAKPLHYINPKSDDPPRLCNYHPGNQDCPNNVCVVAAISNYTAQLSDPSANRNESLKFLIHFIGDLHQPLHATGRARGGTQAQVRFNGRITNLHTLWDSLIFQKRITDDFKRSSMLYSEYLVKSIGTTWRAEVSEWLTCPSPMLTFKNEKGQLIQRYVCPEGIYKSKSVWAEFSNRVNCEFVWPGYKRKFEMSGEYYRNNIKIAEKMLAQAAVRIAAILNDIAELY